MKKTTFVFLLLLLIGITGLGFQAAAGNPLAMVVLAVLATVTLIIIGASISLIHARIAAKQQEAQFNANVRENLAIMQQMQTLQNAQSKNLMTQTQHLPEPTGSPLIIDDAIFSELE